MSSSKYSSSTAFALQGSSCFTGSLVAATALGSSSKCSTPCPGNATQVCGGSDLNGLITLSSVFSIFLASSGAASLPPPSPPPPPPPATTLRSPPPSTLPRPSILSPRTLSSPSPPPPTPPRPPPPPLPIRLSPPPASPPPPSSALSYSRQLFDLVNGQRFKLGLPAVTHSPSLQIVADAHTADLAANYLRANTPRCIGHSWYSGPYACCFDMANTASTTNNNCMWLKPQQLTSYNSPGFEIMNAQAYGSTNLLQSPTLALNMWLSSPSHYAVIASQYPWNVNGAWRAMACSIATVPTRGNTGSFYAVCWFGYATDTQAIDPPY